MTAPTYVDKGAFASGTGAISPAIPAGIRNGDMLVLIVESANEAVTTPTGWTAFPDSPQSTGTAATAGGVRLSAYYRFVHGVMTAPSVADTGNHTTGIVFAIRGVDPTSPFDVTAGGTSAATTSISFPSDTTTVANTLVLLLLGNDRDAAYTNDLGTVSNANLTGITGIHDQGVASGVGGGIGAWYGVKASAGSIGASTATATGNNTHAYITAALKGMDPIVRAVGQYQEDELTVISTGGTTGSGTDVILAGEYSAGHSLTANTGKAEVELTGTSFNDTATYTGPAIVQNMPTADITSSRRGAGMVYDDVNKRYLFFGGFDGTTRYNDLWEKYTDVPGRPWRKVTVSGTPPTGKHLFGMTIVRGNLTSGGALRMYIVIWGGANPSDVNEMHTIRIDTPGSEAWATVTQTSAPSARSYMGNHIVAGSKPASDQQYIYLFGGWASSRENVLVRCTFDVDTPTAVTWSTMTANGAGGSPPARSGAILDYKASTDKLYLYGGYSGSAMLQDFWEYDVSGNSWTQVTVADPGSGGGGDPDVIPSGVAAGGYDAANNRFWFTGGWTTNGTFSTSLNQIVYIGGVGTNGNNTADSGISTFGTVTGATDPQGVWTNDANGFSLNTGDYAETTTNGSNTSNYLFAAGPGTHVTGVNVIGAVAARFYGSVTGGTNGSVQVEIWTAGKGQKLAHIISTSSSPNYTPRVFLTEPEGGWDWATIEGLEAYAYLTNDSGTSTGRLYNVLLSAYEGSAFNNVRVNSASGSNQTYAGNSFAANCIDTDRGLLVLKSMATVDSTERYGYVIDLNDGIATNKPVYGLNDGEYMTPLDAPGSVYDPDGGEWIITGGFGNMSDEATIAQGTHLNDVYAYNATSNTWRYANAGFFGLPHMEGRMMCYDTTRDRILLFGGLTGVAATGNEVWSLTRDARGNYEAAKLMATGTPPSSRWVSAVAYDAGNDRLIVALGGDSAGPTAGVYSLSFTGSADGAWTTLSPSGSVTSVAYMAFWNKTSNSRLYLFGGATNSALTTISTQMVYFDYSTTNGAWNSVTNSGATAVRGAGFDYDATNDRLLLFGGFNGTNPTNVIQAFNLSSGSTWAVYTPATSSGLDARRSTAAAFFNSKLYMTSGRPNSGMWYNDTWDFTPNYGTFASSTISDKWPRMYSPMNFRTSSLADGDYHWQLWSTESSVDSTKVSYGGNAESAADFTIGSGGPPQYTKTHTTNALKRRQATLSHTTDSIRRKQFTRSHTTSSYLKRRISTVINTSYYFDAHNGITDTDSNWTNDANAFNGDTATYANDTGSATTEFFKNMTGAGTNAPSSGPGIQSVAARIYTYGDGIGGVNVGRADVWTSGLGEKLNPINIVANNDTSTGWKEAVHLNAPTGGWSWSIVQNLVVNLYALAGSHEYRVYKVQLEITTDTPFAHTTDANKRKVTTITHTTSANKKKAGNTISHTTSANKKVSGNTLSHTTDAFKTKSFTVSHTTNTLKRKQNTLSHTTNALKRVISSVSHTTNTLLRKTLTLSHTTDSLLRKQSSVTHTTSANKKKANNTLSHTADALKRKQNTVSHTTDAYLQPSLATYTTTHTTNALLRKQVTVSHTTNANKRKVLTVAHTTDANKKKSNNVVSHTTDSNKKKSGNTLTHTTNAFLRRQIATTHTTNALKRKQFTPSHTTNSLLRKQNTVSHTTSSNKKKANLVVSHTTDANKKKANNTLAHTTNALKRILGTLTHTTNSLLRRQLTLSHTTNSFLRKQNTVSHTTSANKRKVTETSHTTDANKKKANNTLTHTTNALKRILGSVSHTTDTLKRQQLTRSHTTDSFLRKQNTRSHTTDSNKRRAYTVTHTTDANKKRANNTVVHTTDANKKKAGLTVSHTTNALLRKLNSLTHTTDSFLRRQIAVSHTTDALKRTLNTLSHTTDSFLRGANMISHNTDANKKKSGNTVSHTTDANKKKANNTVFHTTNVLLRKAFTLSHSTDSNKRKATTVAHTTDSLLRRQLTLTHTTDALKRARSILAHTTNSLLRKQNVLIHTTDSNKKKSGNVVSHTTDSNKRKALTVSHTTSANRRRAYEVSHTTDSNKRKADNTVVHTTDALLRKAFTLTHTTDALKRLQVAVSHTTNSFLRIRTVVSHTTDSNKKRANNVVSHLTDAFVRGANQAVHNTDANKRKALTVSHTTDASKKIIPTLTHTTNVLLRRAITLTHTTSSNKRKANNLVAHTTNALKRARATLSHTTDSNKKKAGNILTHTTNAFLRIRDTLSHSTDSFLRKAQTVTHTTSSNLKRAYTATHTTNSYLRKGTQVDHTTDANKKRTDNTVSHTSDSNKRKSQTRTHTTDSLLRRAHTLSHSTNALLRKAFSVLHTTSANKRKAGTVSHTTSSNLKRPNQQSHTTDSFLRKRYSVSHLTDALLRKAYSILHSTSANKRKAQEASHTTDAILAGSTTKTHTTDTTLWSQRGTKKVLVDGEWVYGRVYVLQGGIWVEVKVKVYLSGTWVDTYQ